MPKVRRKQYCINRVVSRRDPDKPGFVSKNKPSLMPSLMGETERCCYYADGPYSFRMDMHDACMVGTRTKVKDFVDDNLIYSRSERWTLLLGVPGIEMRPND